MSAPARVSMLHERLETPAAHAHSELLDRVARRRSHVTEIS
jgi:hypothetical protein